MPVRNLRLAGAFVVLGIVLLMILISARSHSPRVVNSQCGPYRADKKLQINNQQLTAEVAATNEEQSKGLGGRPCITADQGMLFVFGKPSYYAIWMKGMHFPIDIVWIGSDHKAVGFKTNIQPSTYPDRFTNKSKPAKYVLELQANRVKSLGITTGTPINF